MVTEEEVKMLKALAHPIRLGIVKLLLEKEKCVCEIQENFEFSQANLSQHLRILKEAKVLQSRKIGLKVLYKLQNSSIKNILESIEKAALELKKR